MKVAAGVGRELSHMYLPGHTSTLTSHHNKHIETLTTRPEEGDDVSLPRTAEAAKGKNSFATQFVEFEIVE